MKTTEEIVAEITRKRNMQIILGVEWCLLDDLIYWIETDE